MRKGHRISVGSGSAYDLFLTREIKQAEIVRLQGAGPALAALRSGDVEVAAGIRQLLEGEAKRAPGVRVLPGRFMVIQQAMGTPASRGAEAQALLGRVRRRDEGQRVRRRRAEAPPHRGGDRRAGFCWPCSIRASLIVVRGMGRGHSGRVH
jgi:hypothetical protein